MIRFISLLIVVLMGYTTISQESRDYFKSLEQYNHAIQLYDKQLYPAAYDVFTELIEEDNANLSLFPPEQLINTKLYRALSATLSDQQIGIPLVQQFMDDYPEHPNRSVAHLELGKYYAKNQKFREAFEQFDQVNTNTLTDAQLLDFNMNAGYTYFIRKRFQQAETYLQAVANSSSQQAPDATYYLGLSQYFQEKYPAATRNLERVSNHPKYGSEIPFYIARILFEEEKYEEVLAYKDRSNEPEFLQIIGQSYFNLEQYQEALPYLETYSANAKSQSPEALYQLAYTQYQLRQYDKAIKNFEKLNIVNNEVGQYALYALAQSYLNVNDKEKAVQAFERASKLNFNQNIKEEATFANAKLSYELGRNNDAIRLMQAFIQSYPRSTYRREADEYLVDLFLTSTNYQDALNTLEQMDNRSREMNEAYQKVAYLRAVELYQAGDYGTSKALLDTTIANNYDARYTALANYWLGEMAYGYGRYSFALDYIQKFLSAPVSIPANYQSQANYTAGYAQYNQGNYAQSVPYFQKVSANSSFKTDANLRLGDSYFLQKNYASASQAYQSVSTGSSVEKDYATYQIAILKGLQGNRSGKSNDLQRLYSNSPQSAYADDALFEHGRMALTQENYPTAENRFLQLIRQYPKSEQVKLAYNQLGLLNFNQTKYNEALNYYDKVVKNYPNTDEAASALQAIQEIYINQGNPDGYFAYLKTVKGVSVSSDEQERIVYTSAETQFKNGNCDQAIRGFSNYLSDYRNGFYAANAHFYRGECLNQNGQQSEAVKDFNAVIQLPDNKFTERSLIRVARVEYRQSNYDAAIAAYKRIEEIASNSSSIYSDEVNIGLMQAYNRSKQRQNAYRYAEIVQQQPDLDFSILTEAKFLLAMKKFNNGDETNAYLDLENVAAQTRNQWGAEARYTMALILHRQKQYQRSTTAAYRVADETPAEDDWVAKSFILVARNYRGQNELFQAKATVSSVIENYTGDDQSIMNEANQLLREIEAEEARDSNLLNTETPSNQLQLKED